MWTPDQPTKHTHLLVTSLQGAANVTGNRFLGFGLITVQFRHQWAGLLAEWVRRCILYVVDIVYYFTCDSIDCTCRFGTPGHWPPEVLERRPYNPRSADVWALGVTLYVLLTSRLPFAGDDVQALMSMQKGLDFAQTKAVRLSKEVTELLKGLLHYVLQVHLFFSHLY